ADDLGSKLSQTIERFVCEPRAADNGNCIAAENFRDCVELLCCEMDRFVPGGGDQLAAFPVTNQRRPNTLFVIDERMTEAALNTKELAIQSVNVPIARHDAHQLTAA